MMILSTCVCFFNMYCSKKREKSYEYIYRLCVKENAVKINIFLHLNRIEEK